MTRGFEHRLWGYKVVKIKQPDAERGTVSDATSSVRPTSPAHSFDGRDEEEYGKLVVAGSHDEGCRVGDGGLLDKGGDEYEDGDLAMRSMPGSREGSEEADEQGDVGRWQIPETVVLTSGSLGPF